MSVYGHAVMEEKPSGWNPSFYRRKVLRHLRLSWVGPHPGRTVCSTAGTASSSSSRNVVSVASACGVCSVWAHVLKKVRELPTLFNVQRTLSVINSLDQQFPGFSMLGISAHPARVQSDVCLSLAFALESLLHTHIHDTVVEKLCMCLFKLLWRYNFEMFCIKLPTIRHRVMNCSVVWMLIR